MKKHARFVYLCMATLLVSQLGIAANRSVKDEKLVARLTSPISTKTSKEGDLFTALVLSPDNLSNAVIEGHIRKLQPAENMNNPKSHIIFTFETVTIGDKTYKIEANLEEVANSKGVAKVDEEGQVIAQGNGGKRALAAAGGGAAGAVAGGMLFGGFGALGGSLLGGGAGYLVALDVTASSKEIELCPGSQFTLKVTTHGTAKVDAATVHQQEADAEANMAKSATANPGSTAAPAAQP